MRDPDDFGRRGYGQRNVQRDVSDDADMGQFGNEGRFGNDHPAGRGSSPFEGRAGGYQGGYGGYGGRGQLDDRFRDAAPAQPTGRGERYRGGQSDHVNEFGGAGSRYGSSGSDYGGTSPQIRRVARAAGCSVACSALPAARRRAT